MLIDLIVKYGVNNDFCSIFKLCKNSNIYNLIINNKNEMYKLDNLKNIRHLTIKELKIENLDLSEYNLLSLYIYKSKINKITFPLYLKNLCINSSIIKKIQYNKHLTNVDIFHSRAKYFNINSNIKSLFLYDCKIMKLILPNTTTEINIKNCNKLEYINFKKLINLKNIKFNR